jgi:hypothetical protein
VNIEYFARWIWSEGRGLEPLTQKQVTRRHRKGETYVAYLVDEHLVLTLRPETKFAALGFVSPSIKPLGVVALTLGDPTTIESISVWQHGEQVVRLQDGGDTSLIVVDAPFDEPTEFDVKPLSALAFPALGDYATQAKLPRDPWEYVVLPSGFEAPQPAP